MVALVAPYNVATWAHPAFSSSDMNRPSSVSRRVGRVRIESYCADRDESRKPVWACRPMRGWIVRIRNLWSGPGEKVDVGWNPVSRAKRPGHDFPGGTGVGGFAVARSARPRSPRMDPPRAGAGRRGACTGVV